MSNLTGAQLAILHGADRRWRDIADLAQRRPAIVMVGAERTRTTQGLTMSAASLVRLGYLAKTKLAGHVHYQLTDRGAERWTAEFGTAGTRVPKQWQA